MGLGPEKAARSQCCGDLSLDIFEADNIPDEEAVGLSEGLIDVDAEAVLDECRRIAERLIELPKGQSNLHQRQPESPNDAANENSGSDA